MQTGGRLGTQLKTTEEIFTIDDFERQYRPALNLKSTTARGGVNKKATNSNEDQANDISSRIKQQQVMLNQLRSCGQASENDARLNNTAAGKNQH